MCEFPWNPDNPQRPIITWRTIPLSCLWLPTAETPASLSVSRTPSRSTSTGSRNIKQGGQGVERSILSIPHIYQFNVRKNKSRQIRTRQSTYLCSVMQCMQAHNLFCQSAGTTSRHILSVYKCSLKGDRSHPSSLFSSSLARLDTQSGCALK